jgi:hypothetical protein
VIVALALALALAFEYLDVIRNRAA